MKERMTDSMIARKKGLHCWLVTFALNRQRQQMRQKHGNIVVAVVCGTLLQKCFVVDESNSANKDVHVDFSLVANFCFYFICCCCFLYFTLFF